MEYNIECVKYVTQSKREKKKERKILRKQKKEENKVNQLINQWNDNIVIDVKKKFNFLVGKFVEEI